VDVRVNDAVQDEVQPQRKPDDIKPRADVGRSGRDLDLELTSIGRTVGHPVELYVLYEREAGGRFEQEVFLDSRFRPCLETTTSQPIPTFTPSSQIHLVPLFPSCRTETSELWSSRSTSSSSTSNRSVSRPSFRPCPAPASSTPSFALRVANESVTVVWGKPVENQGPDLAVRQRLDQDGGHHRRSFCPFLPPLLPRLSLVAGCTDASFSGCFQWDNLMKM
jgi:hypothetical protein